MTDTTDEETLAEEEAPFDASAAVVQPTAARPFIAADWYWLATDQRLYSSSRQTLIATGDDAYLAWAEIFGEPSPWPTDDDGEQTDAALQIMLSPHGLFVTLADLKQAAKTRIDAEAERQRLRFITPGSGQAMTYQAKVEEARRLMADPSTADPVDFPLLSAEVGITAPTLVGVGDVVLAAYQQWLLIGGAIEAARLGAKGMVEAATTAAEVAGVAVQWPPVPD